jgi:hypothetical protein
MLTYNHDCLEHWFKLALKQWAVHILTLHARLENLILGLWNFTIEADICNIL